ncbi:MAG: CoA-binding protein [Candidatus Aenigmarchaeota archaeon]|nr:CoA-binding protein [Candidatus Aenigmarchaeota archaeon]
MRTNNFLRRGNTIAVVGVSANPEKWGYRIYKTLKQRFREVYPVNPKYREIEGDECYPDLKSLPQKPDVVITVVPPKIVEKVVKTAKELGIRKVWMQPGSESGEAINFCENNGIICMHNACFVMDGLKTDL